MLPAGTWTGTLIASDDARQPVEAEIERCATGVRVSLGAGSQTAETEMVTWERRPQHPEARELEPEPTALPRTLA